MLIHPCVLSKYTEAWKEKQSRSKEKQMHSMIQNSWEELERFSFCTAVKIIAFNVLLKFLLINLSTLAVKQRGAQTWLTASGTEDRKHTYPHSTTSHSTGKSFHCSCLLLFVVSHVEPCRWCLFCFHRENGTQIYSDHIQNVCRVNLHGESLGENTKFLLSITAYNHFGESQSDPYVFYMKDLGNI